MGNVGFVGALRKPEQIGSVDPEDFDDPSQRVRNRGIDLRGGEVDETRRQLGQQPGEHQQILARRGPTRRSGAASRFGHSVWVW
ncbi:MAG: hypothetical protein ABI593_13625 [Betaproteobacteria bacterium]